MNHDRGGRFPMGLGELGTAGKEAVETGVEFDRRIHR
jgi:hypothetical protein